MSTSRRSSLHPGRCDRGCAGAIPRAGDDPMGIIGTIGAGSLARLSVVGSRARSSPTAGIDWIASIIAAIVLVLLWRAVARTASIITQGAPDARKRTGVKNENNTRP